MSVVNINKQELREDRGEVELARKHQLPHLVNLGDIRGDLHAHTDWSDGTASIAKMATAAKARGYEYLAITDHSRRVTVAHGLDLARLSRQIRQIDSPAAHADIGIMRELLPSRLQCSGALTLRGEVVERIRLCVTSSHFASLLVREQTTNWACGEKLPRHTAEHPLAETAMSICTGDEQVGAFILR